MSIPVPDMNTPLASREVTYCLALLGMETDSPDLDSYPKRLQAVKDVLSKLDPATLRVLAGRLDTISSMAFEAHAEKTSAPDLSTLDDLPRLPRREPMTSFLGRMTNLPGSTSTLFDAPDIGAAEAVRSRLLDIDLDDLER